MKTNLPFAEVDNANTSGADDVDVSKGNEDWGEEVDSGVDGDNQK